MSLRYYNVAPLARLPRGLDTLTYSYKSDEPLKPGSIVTIPLRKKTSFALVFSVTEEPVRTNATKKFEVKSILDIITTQSLLSETLFGYYQHVARWYGVNIGTILKMALPPLQKRKLGKLPELIDLSITEPTNRTRPYTAHLYKNQAEQQALLEKLVPSSFSPHHCEECAATTKQSPTCTAKDCRVTSASATVPRNDENCGATLIIVPEKVDIVRLKDQLPDAIEWHSDMSPKQHYDAWAAMHTASNPVIIGTRSAALLPLPQLSTIILDAEHDDNHKAWEGTPRLFVPDMLDLRKRYQDYTEHRSTYSPSMTFAYDVAYEKATSDFSSADIAHQPLNIIDLADERRAGRFGVLADKTKNIITAAKGDVLILVGRRGYATTISCTGCGHLLACEQCESSMVYHLSDKKVHCHHCNRRENPTWICTKCNAQIDAMKGYGTELLEEGVAGELAGGRPVLRVDADSDDPETDRDASAEIIVGTTRALQFARWSKVTDIVMLDVDKQLSWPEYDAEERVWHMLSKLQFLAPAATVHIQTYTKEHSLFETFTKPKEWYAAEMRARQLHGYSPFTGIIRLLYGHAHAGLASKAAREFTTAVNKLLTTEQKSRILQGPAPLQPSFHRGQHWQAAIAKLDREHWFDTGIKFLRIVPRQWKIDPSPRNLLSP